MNKLSKEKLQQIILVGVVTVAVLAGLWFLAFSKLSAKRKETNDAITAKEKQISDGERKRKSKETVKKELEVMEKKLGGLESAMANGDLFSWADQKLKDFIRENGMTGEIEILNMSRGEVVDIGLLPKFPYKGVKYAVRGTAYYHGLGKFVSGFENQFPHVRLQNIELTPGDQLSPDPEKLTFRFEIVALQKPTEAPAETK